MFVQVVLKEATSLDVIFFVRSAFTLSVCCARWTSASKIFLDLIGLVNRLDHSVLIHSFMMSSSHRVFCWNIFLTRLSFDFFFLCSDSKTFSLKDDCRSNPINTISKYSKRHCCLSFIKTELSALCPNLFHTFNVISLFII